MLWRGGINLYIKEGFILQKDITEKLLEEYPVVTIVLNMGMKKWTAPITLYGRLNIPDFLKPYVSNYKINVFDVAYISDEQLAMFKSDFYFVAEYLVQMRRDKNYHPSEKIMEHVDETLKMMSVVTNDNRFIEAKNEAKKRGVNKMCEALDIIEERGRTEGEFLDIVDRQE